MYELAGISVPFLGFVVLFIMHDSVTDNAFRLCLRVQPSPVSTDINGKGLC